MKLIIQRVKKANVTVDKKPVGSINAGYVILLGVKKDDTEKQADKLAEKLLNLRIMADDEGKMNRSIVDVQGEILVISQFTLYADTKSRRPGFTDAADPEDAERLYTYFVQQLKKSKLKIETGIFGAYMAVELINDGPITITLEI